MTGARTLRGPLLALVAAFAMSGCGTHPGAAAVVGGETISEDRLDDVALALCSAQSGASETGPAQDLAGRAARQGALGVLLNGALSRQYGESKGVEADQAQVSAAVAANESTIGQLPSSRRSVFRDTLRDYAEGQLILLAIGRSELSKRGTANAPEDQAIAAGVSMRDAWVKKSLDVSVDPRYGEFSNGTLAAKGGSLSVAVSSRATEGAKQQPSSSWVSALPANQKCS